MDHNVANADGSTHEKLAQHIYASSNAPGRSRQMFRRGSVERRDLAGVKVGHGAQPVGKDADQYRHHHRKSDRWLPRQVYFLLQIYQPENDGRQPAWAEPPHEYDRGFAQPGADERGRNRQHPHNREVENRIQRRSSNCCHCCATNRPKRKKMGRFNTCPHCPANSRLCRLTSLKGRHLVCTGRDPGRIRP